MGHAVLRKLGMGRALLLCLTLIILAAAPQAMAQARYSSVDVRGNQRIETSTILTYAGIRPNEPVTAGQVNAGYQRILGSGLFESVELIINGNTLIIQVDEFPTVNQINIEGNKRIDDDVLIGLLTTQPSRVYSPSTAEADARIITDAYRQSGRLAATVQPKIIPRSQNRVDLVFEVTEGRVVEIERIGFVGNRNFSDRRLRQILGTKQAGIFRALVSSDTFIEDRVQFDRQLLTDFYRSRGYVDFEVLSVTPEFSRERDAFFLTFNIQEGQKFNLGRISTSSEITGLDPAPFGDILKIRTGQPYTPNRIEDSIARIERKALKDGLDFVVAEPRVTRNDRDLTLDVNFVLVRGPRVFVERIDIEGNQTTLDQVIRRQFDVVEGDPFNPREIRESAERIRALGYFAVAEVNAREGTQPDRMIVDVDVEEQSTGNLSLGLSFSLDDGVGAAFGINERNFLGRGQLLNFSLAIGVSNANSVISLTDPALLGRDLSGTSSLFYRTTNNFSADFSTRELGFAQSFGFPVSENGRLALSYELVENEIKDVDYGDPNNPDDNGSSVIIQREEGKQLTSALGYKYTFDTRRRGLNPNAGVRIEFGQDFAGLGGDTKYIRTTALVGAETKLFNEEIGLTIEVQGGSLNSLEGTNSSVIDRYRGGGRVRGFTRNGIGPRDLTATNEDALGGNYVASVSVEADFPLGLPVEYGIRGGVFYDFGSIWGLDDTAGTEGEVDDDFHLRSVIGASIFWTTPIGPLRFDFTKALDKEVYDKERTFDLTISTRF